MAHSSYNEKTKLTATLFNNIGTACLVVGVLTPVGSAIFDAQSAVTNVEPGNFALVFMVGWITGGFALHLVGRAWLSRIREDD